MDIKYMQMALRLAEEAAGAGEVPVGAVLVSKDGRVLATGRNMPIEECDPTAHAEIVTLRAAASAVGNYRLTGTTLYVTIEPCPMCAGALLAARVRRLVFGAMDRKSGACGSLYNLVQDARFNHRVEITSGVLEEECRKLMQEFFRARRAHG